MAVWLLQLVGVTAALIVPAGAGSTWADDSTPSPDLADYKTVETAATTTISRKEAPPAAALPGYLGVSIDTENRQAAVIAGVDADSPAAQAGLKPGDVLLKVDGRDFKDRDSLFETLRGKLAGDTIELALARGDKPQIATAKLAAWSRPLPSPTQNRVSVPPRASLGVQIAAAAQGEGVTIEQVIPGSTAERAKLKVGETLLKIDNVALASPAALREFLAGKRPEQTVTLTLMLAEKTVEMKIALDAERGTPGMPGIADGQGGPGGGGPGGRGGPFGGGGPGGGMFGMRNNYWSKPTFRLAIICVEYPDSKHNPKICNEEWEKSLFSEGIYNKTNATGDAVHGSLRDYYLEQSYGKFKVEGKVFDWLEVGKKRAEYATGNRMALLTEALDKLLVRDGKEALKDFDGVFFIYAGNRYPAPRGSLYWPHRASVNHGGKRWPYFIVEEGGSRMQGLSVLCHEFGHMLGLPDLYARPENPGMEGVGIWCCMSQQPNRTTPQHFSAWAKEKVGWIQPAVIDPSVKQKLVLAPIEDSPKECFKVLIRPDGSEYLLLENRRKKGFDKSLPAEGLLIWRVAGNRPTLKESHGIEGPSGPRVFLNDVPYPSAANDSYTPFTTPSSRSELGGGAQVNITNIKRLADGRIGFHIGYEYQ
jgi:M6 family metalloprotease-like protein